MTRNEKTHSTELEIGVLKEENLHMNYKLTYLNDR